MIPETASSSQRKLRTKPEDHLPFSDYYVRTLCHLAEIIQYRIVSYLYLALKYPNIKSPPTCTMQMRINIPPLTRVLLGLLIAISTAHQITRYFFGGLDPELLALVPQWSLFYPWVYITATFAEQNVVTLLIAGATILYGGKYLERAWGSTEFGKFVLLVTVLPNLIATFVYVLWFAITHDDSRAYVEHSSLHLITRKLIFFPSPQLGFYPRLRCPPRRLPCRFQAART